MIYPPVYSADDFSYIKMSDLPDDIRIAFMENLAMAEAHRENRPYGQRPTVDSNAERIAALEANVEELRKALDEALAKIYYIWDGD